ncbi:unnamed protein product [Trichogramma brassicae]|uniref:Uncharacterized protein n=1 Tax=Trichogramma brassicae TaxID=86971 RepID=A0A6H5J0I3_9HYME|nr:unnamed protein product [Trichogramma brassicae]
MEKFQIVIRVRPTGMAMSACYRCRSTQQKREREKKFLKSHHIYQLITMNNLLQAVMALIVIIGVQDTSALSGYMCGRNTPNFTSVMTSTIGNCEVHAKVPEMQKVYVQLLQHLAYRSTTFFSCRVIVNRIIRYCGAISHNKIVQGGDSRYVHMLTKETCSDAIKYNELRFESITIRDLIVNATNRRTLTIAGELATDGICTGVKYITKTAQYDTVVVTADLVILLTTGAASFDDRLNRIVMADNLECPYRAGTSVDISETSFFWNLNEFQGASQFDQYAILYEGDSMRCPLYSGHTVLYYTLLGGLRPPARSAHQPPFFEIKTELTVERLKAHDDAMEVVGDGTPPSTGVGYPNTARVREPPSVVGSETHSEVESERSARQLSLAEHLKRLNEKITEMMDFAMPRNNVHKPIKEGLTKALLILQSCYTAGLAGWVGNISPARTQCGKGGANIAQTRDTEDTQDGPEDNVE